MPFGCTSIAPLHVTVIRPQGESLGGRARGASGAMRGWLEAYLELMGAITMGACTVVLVWGTGQEDEWRGFVYPDHHVLAKHHYVGAYTSHDQCRAAAQAVIGVLPQPSAADFECVLNCRAQARPDDPTTCARTER